MPSTLHGCVKYFKDGIGHCIWMDEEPFSHCNMVNLPNGLILPSTHIFPKTIPFEHDSSSLGTIINKTSQNLKLESIHNKLVLTKNEPSPLDECYNENPSNIHREFHEKMPIKPSPTIQEEISWKAQADHL